MRTESEIREAHSYMRIAYDQAAAEGEQVEADKISMACHALIWVLGHGEIFAKIVEAARKTEDDHTLEIETLD